MAANELTLRVLRSPPHGCFFSSEVCNKCSGIMHLIVLYCRYLATQSLLHSHHCSSWNVNRNNWLPWQWSSFAQINHKTVSVTVVRRHIPYEQKRHRFSVFQEKPMLLCHTQQNNCWLSTAKKLLVSEATVPFAEPRVSHTQLSEIMTWAFR